MTQLRQQVQTGRPLGYAAESAAEDALAYAKSAKGQDPITPRLVAKEPAATIGTTVRPAIWTRGFGDFERRDGTQAVTTSLGTGVIDQGYRGRIAGVMVGGDVVIGQLTSSADALILGATAGYLNSRISFSSGNHNLEGPSVGAYGTYVNGGFFWDALAKVDLLGFDTDNPLLPRTADLTNYNFVSNVGYKFDLASKLYIEPTIGIEHVRSNFTNQQIIATTFAALDDARMTRGRFGTRVGTEWIAGNFRIEPSAALLGYYYFEATGSTVQLGPAGGTVVLPTDRGKLRGEVQASVNVFDLSSGWSGFVRSDVRFQEHLFGVGGKVGVRYQW